jgi:hypothetical protein
MSPTSIIDQGLERIAALLDRIELQCDGLCDVEGCIHHESRFAVAGVGAV